MRGSRPFIVSSPLAIAIGSVLGAALPGVALGQSVITTPGAGSDRDLGTAITMPDTNVYDVRSGRTRGRVDFNSFGRFEVAEGDTVNLLLNDGANTVVNLVWDARALIDGTLNSYMGDEIGGRVFFADSHGLVVGETGVLNVGSLAVATTTQAAMTGLLGEANAGSGATPHLDALMSGTAPLSDNGHVEIAGRVNARDEVRVLARSIDASGTVWVADAAHGPGNGGAVNTGDDDTFQLIQEDGRILLAAADSLVVSGTVHAGGGDVLLHADDGVSIAAGAVVSARDLGERLTDGDEAALSVGDSGSVLVTGRDILVAAGARIETDADRGHAAGDIDLHASDMAGGQTGRFSASSSVHANGTLRGGDIRMTATAIADSSWTDPDADLLTVAANELVEIAQKAGSELGGTIGYLATDTRAEVVIGADADIAAAGDVTALARTGQTLETSVTGLKGEDQLQDYVSVGALWADLDTVANAVVESGASIHAGGTLAVKAETDSTLDISATSFAAGGTAVAMTLAISTIDIQADATIESGANLQVGGLDVGALNTSSFSTTAKAHSDEEGAVGLAAAVSLQDVSANAWVGSGVEASGDVTVQAASLATRNAMEAGVSAPPEDDQEPAAQGGGESDGDDAIAGLMGQGFDKLTGILGSQGGDDDSGGGSTPSAFRLGGAMTYLEGDHAASAKIGDAAEITAGGDVGVHANVEDAGISVVAGTAIAAQGKNDDGSALSLSAGVSLTNLTHDADAGIGAGVVVDAERIGVGSEVVLPHDLSKLEAAKPDFSSFGAFIDSLNAARDLVDDPSEIFTSYGSASASADTVAIGGVINHYKVTNRSRAWVGEGAQLTSRAAAAGEGETSAWETTLAGEERKAEWLDAVSVQALSDSQSMHAAGELKLGSVEAGQDGAAIGGSFNNVVYDTTTIAGIAADAVIHADDGVAVDATTRDNVVSLALMSGEGSSIGVDGTLALLDVSSNTRASVSRDADITAGALEVDALQDLFVWSVSGALAMANGISVGLGVGIHNLSTDTRAYIGDNSVDAADAADDAQAVEGVRGDGRIRVDALRVSAQSKGLAGAIAVAGAVTQSDSQQSVDEDKKPGFMAKLKDSAESNVASARDSAGDAFSGLPGLGMLTDKLRGEQGMGADPSPQPAQPKFGISVSGSASVNLVSQDVAAYLDGADVAGRPTATGAGAVDRIDVAALNDTVLASASGSAAITRAKADSSKFSAAIGGAVAYSMVDNDTDAHVGASRLADANDVAIHAISGGEQTNVALGVSVNASSNQSTALSAVGSFTIGRSSNDTRAGLEDSELIAGDADGSAVDVSAYGRTHVGTGAGSLYYGGRGGIGAAFTHGDIRDETGASIDGGSILGFDRVELNALDASRIIAGAAMAGGGGQSNGLAGAVVYNNVDNTTRARIGGGAQIDIDGDLLVRAAGTGPVAAFEDRLHEIDSDAEEGFNYSGAGLDLDVQESDGVDLLESGTSIIAVAGLVQAGKNSLGLSFVGNDVSNTHAVEVTDAVIDAGGTAKLDARDSTAILGISVGLGVSTDKFAGVGSATANMIENRTRVLLGDATPGAGATVFNVAALDATAADNSFIGSLAGSVVLGGKAAVGAAISYNDIGNTTSVEGEDIEVTANGRMAFDAGNNARIVSGAIAGAAANNVALAGSFGWSEIGNTTEAVLRNSTLQGGDIDVHAGSGSDIFTLSGSVAVSGKAGIGAAINIADIGDRTEARIEDSNVDVDGGIEVLAEGTGIARSLAVAGAVAGNVAVGGSSSNAIVDNVIAARVSGLSGVVPGAGAGADALIVRAENTGEAASLAGAVAGSGSAAIGAAVSVNLVGGETVAELLDSELEVRDSVAVEAASSARINTLAAAGAAAGSVGGTLTSTNNVVASSTRATLADTSLRPSDPDTELEDILTDTTVSAVDSSRIDSIATSVGVGGSVGLGAAVAINVIGSDVSAEVLGGQNARRYLGRNLVVHAESNSDAASDGANINTIAAGAGGGGSVGGAGSVAVNVMDGSVSAQIADGADIVSVNNVGVLAANTQGINVFAGALAGGGTAGVGLGTVVNVMEGSTRAAVTGADTRVSALATDADDLLLVDDGTLADVSLSGIEDIADYVAPDLRGGIHEVSGLAVNAASRQHVTTIGASAAAAGYAAGAVMAGANVIGGRTDALIEDATINQHAEFALVDPDDDLAGIELNSQQIDVRASSHAVGANMVAGFAGSGGGAGAGALATNVFNGRTSAAIRDAGISAMQGVAVNANASQNSLAIGAGMAAGGLVGGAGTAIVNVFDASTEAVVEGGELEARSLDVEANNRNVASLVGGAVAGGGGAMAGSFVVNVSQTRTSATLGRAGVETIVDARDGIAVAADADTTFEGVAISGALGGAVGVAGMAQVNVLANSVDAAVLATDADAGGNVTVSAYESLSLNAYSGAMAGAVFGGAAGAGASVTVLSSRVAAIIADSDIEALGDVGVSAGSDREVDMISVTAGVGASAGIGAAASVLLSGVGDIGDVGSELGGTLAALDSTGQGNKVDADVVGGSIDGDRLDQLEQDANVRLDSALDGGEDRVMALVLDSSVDADNVSVSADSTLSTRNLAGGVGVGGIGAGGAVAFSGLYGKSLAMVEQTRAGATSISARGNVAISASSDDGASGAMAHVEAYAGGAGLVGLGAAVAIARSAQEVGASAAGTLSGAGDLTISAHDGGSLDVDAVGAAAGAAAVGIVVADARRESVVSAALHSGSQALGFSSVDVSALGNGAVHAYGLGAAGGVLAAGTGAGVTARDDSEVIASIGDGAVVETDGEEGAKVTATVLQDVAAAGYGAAVSGGVTVGAVVVEASSKASALAEVGDGVRLPGTGGLEVSSSVAPVGVGVVASSVAGTGGLFVSLNASSTRAHSQARSIARVGDDVELPEGDVHIVANNTTHQSADATGISVGGLAAAGAVVVEASSDTVTRASLGDRAINHEGPGDARSAGSVLVKAEGIDRNTARALGGSGGLVSGNAASARTVSQADVAATVGEDVNLLADSIGINASHQSLYQANSDSRNAALVGGSGAMAYNTADAGVHAAVGAGSQLSSAGDIDIRAMNVFDALGASTASAAGGGVINGSASDMRTRLTGNSSASVGENATLLSGLEGSLSGHGNMNVIAATQATTRDEADLSTGGAIDVAVVGSRVDADFENAVDIGRDAVLGSFGYLNLGTYTQGLLASSALVNTWGLAAVGQARSNVDVDDRHSVQVGESAKLESLRNTYILAGSDRYGLQDSRISVVSNAEGYVRGLIAVPSASSNVDVTSKGNAGLAQGSEVLSASNVTVGAPETMLSLAANGVGRGYQLGFIPVTQRSSTANGDTSGVVTIDGDVVAGRYNELEILIDSDGELVQHSGLPVGWLEFSSFQIDDFLYGLCGSDETAEGCAALQALVNVVGDDDRGAFVLSPLFAAGGDVFLDGTSISGSGSVNAQGDARISVINRSDSHLLMSALEIPDNPGGNVNFVGAAGSAGDVEVTQAPGGGMPTMLIHNAAGGVGNAPLLMLMEDIHNLSGSVELRSDHGSIGQLGTVYAAQQNVHAPNGVVTFSNRNGDWFSGSNPMADWRFSLRSGALGGYSSVSDPSLAVVVIANAQFNPSSQQDLHNKLYYRSPRNSSSNYSGNSLVLFGSCRHGTGGGQSDAKDGCTGGPFGRFETRYEDHNDVGAFLPHIPYLPSSYMNRSVANYGSNQEVARNAGNSSFHGQQIFVEARYIDINSRISAGAGTNWSLNVSESPDLQAWLARQDQSGSGIVRIPTSLLGADAGSRKIGASYDVANRRIIVDDINASGGGLVHLDGRIVSTTPHGAIDVSSGFGQVSIDSGLDRQVQLQDINVGAGPDGVVTIIDRLKAQQHGNPHTTWYVHSDGTTRAYDNSNGATSYLDGVALANTGTYAPQANTRFQWTQQARVGRAGRGGSWYWVDAQGQPLDAGQEWRILNSGFQTNVSGAGGMGVYESWVSGSFSESPADRNPVAYSCKESGWCSFGYNVGYNRVNVPAAGSGGSYGHGQVVWEFSHVRSGTLNVTSSVKADNTISIDFVGNQHGLVDVDTTGDLFLTGRIYNPGGLTRLGTSSGWLSGAGDIIRTTDRAMITTRRLEVDAAGGVGTVEQGGLAGLQVALGNQGALVPGASQRGIHVRSGSSAGVALNVRTDAPVDVIAGSAAVGYGDVRIEANGDILALNPGAAVNITGADISLVSNNGAIGSTAAPLQLRAVESFLSDNTLSGGTVNATASGNIGLRDSAGDFWVGRIESRFGDVYLHAPSGSLQDASLRLATDGVTQESIDQVRALLRLDGSGVQDSIAAFEGQVTNRYHEFWQLRELGEMVDGQYVPGAGLVPLFRAVAEAARGEQGLTDQQVLGYVSERMQGLETFFANEFGADWSAQEPFQAHDAGFSFAIDPASERYADFARNSSWTDQELRYSINANALRPSGGSVGQTEPTVIGRNIRIEARDDIGRLAPDLDIPYQDMLSGNLDDAAAMTLALANAPGDVLIIGPDGQELTQADLAGLTDEQIRDGAIQSIRIRQTSPLFLQAAQSLAGQAGGNAYLQGVGNLLLDGLEVGGNARLAANGSIANADGAVGAVLTTGGDVVLNAGSGIGRTRASDESLVVAIGGRLLSASSGQNLLLTQESGDLVFGSVYANGRIGLDVPAGALLGFQDDVSLDGHDVRLTALGDIAGVDDRGGRRALQLNVSPDGQLDGLAGGRIWLSSPEQALNIGTLDAGSHIDLLVTGGTLSAQHLHSRAGTLAATVLGVMRVGRAEGALGVWLSALGGMEADEIEGREAALYSGEDIVVGVVRVDESATMDAGKAVRINTGGKVQAEHVAIDSESLQMLADSRIEAGSAVEVSTAQDQLLGQVIVGETGLIHLAAGGQIVGNGDDVVHISGGSQAAAHLGAGSGIGAAVDELRVSIGSLDGSSMEGDIHLDLPDGGSIGTLTTQDGSIWLQAGDALSFGLIDAARGLSLIGWDITGGTVEAGELGVDISSAASLDVERVVSLGSGSLASTADTMVTSLEVALDLAATAGGDLSFGTAIIDGNAALQSVGNTTIDTLAVGADLDSVAGGALSLQTGWVGGQALLDTQGATTLGEVAVDGDLVAEAGTGFEAADLTVGGDAAVTATDIALATARVLGDADLTSHASTTLGLLEVGRSLTADAGTTLSADEVLVGGSAVLASGTDTTVTALEVGVDLAVTAGGDLTVGTADIDGNATLGSAGDTAIDTLAVGADLEAVAGGSLSLQTGHIGGQALLDTQGGTTLGDVAVGGDLVAEAGAGFEATDLTVGGEAAVTAADLTLATARILGDADLTSHASTTLGLLEIGRSLAADAGTTLSADEVLVGNSAVLASGTDTTVTALEVGDELAVTAGGDLTLGTANIDRNVALESVGNTTITTLEVGADLLSISGADLTLGTATIDGNATLASVGDTTIETLAVGSDLAATAGGDLTLGTANIDGNSTLGSVDDTTIDTLAVGADLEAVAGGSLSLQTGHIGGQALLDTQGATTLGDVAVDGDLVAEAGAGFEATELTVGGDAAVTATDITLATARVRGGTDLASDVTTTLGLLEVGGSLTADAGTTLFAEEVLAGGSAVLASGTDTTVTTLEVGGDLAATAGGDLTLGTANVDGNATLKSVGNTTIDTLAIGADLLSTSGADLTLGSAAIDGDAALESAGDTTIDTLAVGADLESVAGGALSLQTGHIGGQVQMYTLGATTLGEVAVEGDLVAEAGTGFEATDLTVGGDAAVTATDIALVTARVSGDADLTSHASTTLGLLEMGGSLTADAGVTLFADEVLADGSAVLASGTDTTVTTLEVGVDLAATAGGDLTLGTTNIHGNATLESTGDTTIETLAVGADLESTAGADLTLGMATINRNATLESVGDTTIDTLSIGADLEAVAGGTLSLKSGWVGGQALLDTQGATTLGEVAVEGDLVAEAGAGFEATDLTVGGDAAVTAADIALVTARVAGDADLSSHASTTLGLLEVDGSLTADAGTALSADGVLVGDSAVLASGSDTTITTLEVGEELAATTGGDLTLDTATIGANAALESEGDTTIDTLAVGVELEAAAGGVLSLQTGTVMGETELSAGRDVVLGSLAGGAGVDVAAGRSIGYESIDAGNGITAQAAEGDIDGGIAMADGAILFEAGNDIRVASLTAGERVNLVAGRDVEGQSVSAMGTDVTVHAGHDIELEKVAALRDVLLHAGNGIRLVSIDAGRDLTADAGVELRFDTVGAGRDLALRSRGGGIEGVTLQAGRHADLEATASVAVGDSSTGGDYRIVAGGDTDLLRYRVGGHLGLKAGGDVRIGEGHGSEMQQIDAGGSIAFDAVSGTDAIRMEASGGGIDGQLLSAPDAYLSAREHIRLDLARIDSRLNLAAADIDGTVEQTGDGSDPIEMVLTGYRDGVAQRIILGVGARDAWIMNRLAAIEAELETDVAKVDIEEGRIGQTMSLTTPVTRTWMHNQDPTLRPVDVHLIQPGLDFMLSQRGNHTFTDAYVVRYAPGFWVEAPNHLAPRYWTDVDYYAESALRFTFRTLEGELWLYQGLARHPFTSWGVEPALEDEPVRVERNAVNTGVSH